MKKPPVCAGTSCPSPMAEDISGNEKYKMPAWARDKMFRHQQGAFPFPELQLSKGELHFD
jgi:hypothetical protein